MSERVHCFLTMSSTVKATCVSLGLLLLFCEFARGLIVPEEIPTVLSLVYSNIPPIKKGTDSRLGIGFRLGEHADIQFIVELGPQTETEPIGTDVARRRSAMLYSAMRGEMGPWAQAVAKYQTQRRIQTELQKNAKTKAKLTKIKQDGEKGNPKKVDSSDWLTKWSKGMLNVSEDTNTVPKKSANVQRISLASDKSKGTEKKIYSNNSTSDIMEQLKKLYILQTQKNETSS